MINVDLINCTGCTACEAVCKVNAIKLVENSKGFKYPLVNSGLCINCGLCNKVCLCYQKEIQTEKRLNEFEMYIATHKEKEVQKKSQSGGVSFAIGEQILQQDGVVYGCIFDKDNKAIHSRCTTIKQLKKTRGSKYVQSDLKNTFREVFKDLSDNKKVLFTGTSCQIEGLFQYLKAKNCKTDNLFTADIICHGVPSPKVLEDFLLYIENKHNSKVKKVNLRDRQFTPNQFNICYLENNEKVVDKYYLELFYSKFAMRESCGVCKFTKFDKPADITMGDIIGIDEKYDNLIDEKYTPSIVIVHSTKGKELLKNSLLKLIKINNNEFSQPNLKHPSKISPQTNNFWKDYNKHGFEFVLKKYTSAGGFKTKLKRKILKFFGLW